MRCFEVEHLRLPGGWASPGRIVTDDAGRVVSTGNQRPEGWREAAVERLRGYGVWGLPNLHSHAFQRVLAGRTERTAAGGDSFWTWRAAMYDSALRLSPEDVEAIAAWLFVEMLQTGMTSVAEFHYLHHDPRGQPYADPAELSLRVLSAAERAGIGLTLLPVLYLHGGFGRPASAEQRRFTHPDVAAFLALCERLDGALRDPAAARLGLALHSLRAVAPAELAGAVAGFTALRPEAPIHIHVAEQRREVDECVAALGARPVAWLLDHAGVDSRWCLVHATHVDADERRRLAASGAVAGLCPTTEANLGDGIFPLAEYLEDGGRIGVGTDSHASVGAAEELRTLEYGQRLRLERRNVSASAAEPSVAARLWDAATDGGTRALGIGDPPFAAGRRLELVVLDAGDPRLLGHDRETALDAFVFSSAGNNPVRDVLVGASFVVRDGRHVRHDEIRRDFVACLKRLETTQ